MISFQEYMEEAKKSKEESNPHLPPAIAKYEAMIDKFERKYGDKWKQSDLSAEEAKAYKAAKRAADAENYSDTFDD